ncbi:MAG TPA: nitroreductase family protein [Candidatus Acidoferrales bacterium]|nr:nitroreductase family protein [Candidatus Acidoferrales bacterium]
MDTTLFNQTDRYAALMEIVRGRMTNRAFAAYEVPREHFEMILEAARHAPSGRTRSLGILLWSLSRR